MLNKKLHKCLFILFTMFFSKFVISQNTGYHVPVCKGIYVTGTQTFVTGNVYIKEGKQIFPVLTKITVKGTDLAASTNNAGVYKLNITSLVKSNSIITLVCQANGYLPKEQLLNQLPSQTQTIDFDLTANRIKK